MMKSKSGNASSVSIARLVRRHRFTSCILLLTLYNEHFVLPFKAAVKGALNSTFVHSCLNARDNGVTRDERFYLIHARRCTRQYYVYVLLHVN